MESQGIPGEIQVTRSVFEKLQDRYAFEARGSVEIKGKGQIET
jgi:adenylate cyclase